MVVTRNWSLGIKYRTVWCLYDQISRISFVPLNIRVADNSSFLKLLSFRVKFCFYAFFSFQPKHGFVSAMQHCCILERRYTTNMAAPY